MWHGLKEILSEIQRVSEFMQMRIRKIANSGSYIRNRGNRIQLGTAKFKQNFRNLSNQVRYLDSGILNPRGGIRSSGSGIRNPGVFIEIEGAGSGMWRIVHVSGLGRKPRNPRRRIRSPTVPEVKFVASRNCFKYVYKEMENLFAGTSFYHVEKD